MIFRCINIIRTSENVTRFPGVVALMLDIPGPTWSFFWSPWANASFAQRSTSSMQRLLWEVLYKSAKKIVILITWLVWNISDNLAWIPHQPRFWNITSHFLLLESGEQSCEKNYSSTIKNSIFFVNIVIIIGAIVQNWYFSWSD